MDLRALAALRIGLALLLLVEIAVRCCDLTAHYTDVGLMPRQALLEHIERWGHISIHLASGSWAWQAMLFALQAVAAVFLLVGRHTRWAKLICWLLLISVHSRNPLILQGGDVMLRLMFFWALFMPLGAVWSLDARRSRGAYPPAPWTATLGTAGYLLLIVSIYIFTAVLKNGAEWKNGHAIYYALQIDHFAKQPQTTWVVDQIELLRAMTYSVLAWEHIGPALLLLPLLAALLPGGRIGEALSRLVLSDFWRTLAVLGFIALHLGLFFFLTLGLFPWICMVAWMALLPRGFWDRVQARVQRGSLRRTTAPDGPRVGLRWPAQVWALFCICLCFNWNLSTLNKKHTVPFTEIKAQRPVPKQVRWIGHTLRLDQFWNMFAPYPMKDDGWFHIPGKRRNGEKLDLFTGEPHTLEKPEQASLLYRTQRWRKYMRNFWDRKYTDVRLYYGKWLCYEYNTGTPVREQITNFEIRFFKERTPAPGEPLPEPVDVLLWNHRCFGKSDKSGAGNTTLKKATGKVVEEVPSKTDQKKDKEKTGAEETGAEMTGAEKGPPEDVAPGIPEATRKARSKLSSEERAERMRRLLEARSKAEKAAKARTASPPPGR